MRTRLTRPDIVTICQQKGIKLHPHGRYYKTSCPTPHHEDKNPSCAIYPDTNTWYCFGCHASGDSYNLQAGTWFRDKILQTG